MNRIVISIIALLFVVPLQSQDQNSVSIWVNGACGHCKQRIEATALATRGVLEAVWNKEEKELQLKVNDKFKEERLHYRMAGAGHDTKELLAHDLVYEALPACCHYRPDEEEDDNPGEIEQGMVGGLITENRDQKILPVPGTNIHWAGTTDGVSSNAKGEFSIPMNKNSEYLIISHVGYESDTVHITEATHLDIHFDQSQELEEVMIVHNTAATTFDLKNAFDVQELHEKELLKCACCNLSESFETNPSVDVSVTDAVTGTRQIEMLGLAGPYVQITRENIPHIRGLATAYGMSYVPGSWIDGIQINTGTGSVVNGYESITGQINVEMKKPDKSERIYLNIFGSSEGVGEANLNLKHSFNEELHTGLLLHAKVYAIKNDHNNDGFLDHPLMKNAILMHRWSYFNDKGITFLAGIKGTMAENEGGQSAFDHDLPVQDQSFWGSGIQTKRIEGWMKLGRVFPDKPFTSLGFQMSAMLHDQDSYFGNKTYTGLQQSVYMNLIYMGIIGNTNHQYRTGASFQYDQYDELLNALILDRLESVPGIFAEYTYNYLDKLTLVSGLRGDYHNRYGFFMTPRFHLRYSPGGNSALKMMGGRGRKTANVIVENTAMLASSRMIELDNVESNIFNGLDPETAWNTGVSYSYEFMVASRKGLMKLDYYYTWFENQVVANYDRDPSHVYIYNLEKASYANSVQAQINLEAFRNYDIRLAYRFNDVRSNIDGKMLTKALSPRNRAFVNMAYQTINDWNFDLTVNWIGSKRIPSTTLNPEDFQLATISPSFVLINGQVSKKFGERTEVYLGVENLTNYRQMNPIIDPENPFGDYFDASLIWGPVYGRKIYAGLRLRIP